VTPDDLDYFDYPLPPEHIAQTPAEPRDAARLLVDEAQHDNPATVTHHIVRDLPKLLTPGDVLVVNNTRVLPARLPLMKPTGGKAEVLLLQPAEQPGCWWGLVKGSKKIAPGTPLFSTTPTSEAGNDIEPVVVVHDDMGEGKRLVEVRGNAHEMLDAVGEVPLPPYIHTRLDDTERYQTVFAQHPGSVAAPTAGLHLTNQVLEEIRRSGVPVVEVELQVGLGTFRPVTADRVGDHQMHAERYRVTPESWETITAAERVVAVGTTVVRTLESVATHGALEGNTELFIRRGYDWKMVDRLLTNFHVPKSSLLVMLDAFMGERWRVLYEEALARNYRFLSFGDAMLVPRVEP